MLYVYIHMYVGKKGENITKTRKQHPETTIEVRDDKIYIHSEDIVQRNSVLSWAHEVIATSKSVVVEYGAEDTITLKGSVYVHMNAYIHIYSCILTVLIHT